MEVCGVEVLREFKVDGGGGDLIMVKKGDGNGVGGRI